MVLVYGDQGINAEEYETATYCNLTKTQSEEEEKLSIMWPKAQITVCYWKRKGGDLTKVFLMKKHSVLVRVTCQ